LKGETAVHKGTPHVLALAAYAIKQRGGQFYITRLNRNHWTGPYETLRHATTAIARHLEREWHSARKAWGGT
jgi:hypothetical protein